jgi:hypothetical protein
MKRIAAMPEEKQKSGSYSPGDSIGLISLVLAVITFTVSPPVSLKLLLLVVAVIGVFVALRLAYWSHSWSSVRRVLIASAIGLVLLWIGLTQINAQMKTEDGMTLGTAVLKVFHVGVGYLHFTWPQRLICVVVGVLAVLSGQALIARVTHRKSANKRLAESDKGFLDCKLLAENAVESLGPALAPITKIMGEAVVVWGSLVRPDEKVSSQSTEAQIRGLKQKAQRLDALSNAMDGHCVKLEEVGRLFTEGMPGWVSWMYSQSNAKEDLTFTVANLTRLVSTIEVTQGHSNDYISAVERARGVSRDLNLALDHHIQSSRRVRDANQKILDACKRSLQVANGG